MILFLRTELRDFLIVNEARSFPTCNGVSCLVHEFLLTKVFDAETQITVNAKRSTFYINGKKEVTEHRPWLAAFIKHVDLHGSVDLEDSATQTRPITGAQALQLLDGVPY